MKNHQEVMHGERTRIKHQFDELVSTLKDSLQVRDVSNAEAEVEAKEQIKDYLKSNKNDMDSKTLRLEKEREGLRFLLSNTVLDHVQSLTTDMKGANVSPLAWKRIRALETIIKNTADSLSEYR